MDGSAEQERSWEFIVTSVHDGGRDVATRRRVRSRAMADFRRRHPYPTHRPQRITVELDVTSLLDTGQAVEQHPIQKIDQIVTTDSLGAWLSHNHEQNPRVPSVTGSGPLSPLAASRIDPFDTFPLDRSRRSRELWDHLYDGSCIMFHTMNAVGFLNLLRESAGLMQLLATSSWHLDRLHNNDDSLDYCRYSIVATRSLQSQLIDPISSTGDTVISMVLAFACHANMTMDRQLLRTHLDGLDLILQRRGGLRTLDSSPLLRLMLYLVDVNGALMQDTAPRYSQPVHLVDPILAPDPYTGFDGMCWVLRSVHERIETELRVRNIWGDVTYPGLHISPAVHALLSLPRGSVEDGPHFRGIECFRLAAILYLNELRGNFGIDTTPGKLYASKLHVELASLDLHAGWCQSNTSLLWILTVGAISASSLDEDRAWFTKTLSHMVERAGITSFAAFEAVIALFMWCNQAMSLEVLSSRLSFISQAV